MSPTYTCRRFPQNAFRLSCVQEICLKHQISCVQEMCLKCHLSSILIFSFMPPNLVKGNVPEMSCVLATGNVPEMSCVLATGNLPEILPYTAPGNVKKMSIFPGVGNVHTINRKCELSCTFHGVSWPRKFRISSSVLAYALPQNCLTSKDIMLKLLNLSSNNTYCGKIPFVLKAMSCSQFSTATIFQVLSPS